VTEGPGGCVFYAAKFRKEPLDGKTVTEEISQVIASGLNCRRYGFISRSGFTFEPAENMIFLDLKDLWK